MRHTGGCAAAAATATCEAARSPEQAAPVSKRASESREGVHRGKTLRGGTGGRARQLSTTSSGGTLAAGAAGTGGSAALAPPAAACTATHCAQALLQQIPGSRLVRVHQPPPLWGEAQGPAVDLGYQGQGRGLLNLWNGVQMRAKRMGGTCLSLGRLPAAAPAEGGCCAARRKGQADNATARKRMVAASPRCHASCRTGNCSCDRTFSTSGSSHHLPSTSLQPSQQTKQTEGHGQGHSARGWRH